MQRRSFFGAAAAAGLAGAQTDSGDKRAILELSYIRMRNSADEQMRRTRDFMRQAVAPALKRSGSGPVGLFTNLIAPDSPSIMVVTSYPGLSGMEAVYEKTSKDKELAEAAQEYYRQPGLAFQRVEKSLLRGFPSMPDIEVPPSEDERPARVFELRVYESDNFVTLARKIAMFDDGEIGIFRRLNMLPVFFGETLIGQKMPNLAYMLAFDSLAAREKAWRSFGRDPEWQKMRAQPGLSDAEIVSNISNSMYRPLPGSDIR